SRKLYEMYGPAAYAGNGTKPIYVGTALDDYYTKLDTIIQMYDHLKSPKAFAFVPSRHHAETSRNELRGYAFWQAHWLFNLDKPTTVSEGNVKVDGGKLTYTCTVDSKVPLQHAEALV